MCEFQLIATPVASLLTTHSAIVEEAAGALFFELAIVASLTILATARLSSRRAMLSALALMIPTVALMRVMGRIKLIAL